jgi:hypothetical protein
MTRIKQLRGNFNPVVKLIAAFGGGKYFLSISQPLLLYFRHNHHFSCSEFNEVEAIDKWRTLRMLLRRRFV